VRKARISELKGLTDVVKCYIIGTLFKVMELKPSILKEISQQVRRGVELEVCNYILLIALASLGTIASKKEVHL